MAAPFINRKVAEMGHPGEEKRQLPWAPISSTIVVTRNPPELTPDEKEARKQRRDALAASAQDRMGDWRTKGAPEIHHPLLMHPNEHLFRNRVKTQELAGEFNHADKVHVLPRAPGGRGKR